MRICRKCKNQFDDSVDTCPNCNIPLPLQKKPVSKALIAVLIIVGILIFSSVGCVGCVGCTALLSAPSTTVSSSKPSETSVAANLSENEEMSDSTNASVSSSTLVNESVSTSASTTSVHAIGDRVEVGDLAYTILNVSETTEFASNDGFTDPVTTEGMFVVLEISIENLDAEERYIDSNLFSLIDDAGREFAPTDDNFDLMLILGDANIIFEPVNPGLSRTGTFVFEVPSDVQHYSLQMYSGLGFSGGEAEVVQLK